MIAMRTTLAICASAIFSVACLGQQDFSGVEIKTTPVAGKVYMLEGRGGNIGVSVGSDGILIVDDQFAPLADKIKAALAKLGSDKPKFILNTHWHGDHTGGNPLFGRDGTIIAHTSVRERLIVKQELFGQPVEPLPKEGLPIITFDHSLAVHFNDEEIRVIHLPNGHTDGDCVVVFTKSNVVHMGDHMFAGMFPFVDLDHGGNVEGMAKNIANVIAQLPPDVKIIPGHGPIATLDDLKTFHRMLVETTDIVKKRIAAGKTLDQIKAEGLPDPWKSWGDGFIKTDAWLETIHKSLSKSP
jgi:glyoxylase-like metal-dependent hydrolase (beta-lactamase superfamily II)